MRTISIPTLIFPCRSYQWFFHGPKVSTSPVIWISFPMVQISGILSLPSLSLTPSYLAFLTLLTGLLPELTNLLYIYFLKYDICASVCTLLPLVCSASSNTTTISLPHLCPITLRELLIIFISNLSSLILFSTHFCGYLHIHWTSSY